MKVTLPGQGANPTSESISRRLRRLVTAILGGVLLVVLVYEAYDGMDVQRRIDSSLERWGSVDSTDSMNTFEKLKLFVAGSVSGLPGDQSALPQLVIDVPFKNMRKIYAKRDRALQLRQLVQGPDDFVNGEVRLEDRVVPIKLRLKGDDTDHLTGKKWSFRIRVRNDDQLFGMRRFSIQHPKTRAYQAEALFFAAAKSMGIIVPRYFFVDVILNGEAVGIMALEEFFAKELVEHNRRREGVILRYTESNVWAARDTFLNYGAGWEGAFDYFGNADVDAIASGKIVRSEVLSRQYEVAQGLLKGFSAGALDASETFDAEKLGTFIALSDVFGAWHPLRWHNMRFYFNPVSLKLEPVAYDASLQYRYQNQPDSVIHRDPLTIRMLEDKAVREAYLDALSDLLSQLRDNSLQDMLNREDERLVESIRSEFRALSAFPTDYLLRRAEVLTERFNNDEKTLKDYLFVYLEEEKSYYPTLVRSELLATGDDTVLLIQNAIPMDVVVDEVAWVNADGARVSATVDQLPLDVPARGIRSAAQGFELLLEQAPQSEGWHIEVLSRLSGRNWYLVSRPTLQSPALEHSPLPGDDIDSLLEKYPFLQLDASTSQLTLPAGQWVFDESLIIPKGFALRVDAGAILRFGDNAALVAYGTVVMNGTADAPVRLGPNETSSWLGMIVLNAPSRSILSHTHVDKTRSVTIGGWTLTGGVNFYKSDVTIKDSVLTDSLGEDALNIIESQFDIHDTRIDGTASDAFDSDFSEGTVSGGSFVNIGSAGGGDAIDVSGSSVTVTGVRFERVSDKALSIGERSRLRASDVTIINSGTGAAAKDGSILELNNVTIEAASFAGVTAYVKKAEYGAAEIRGDEVLITQADLPVLVQTGSRVELNGTVYDTQEVNVDELYETVMRPGLRR